MSHFEVDYSIEPPRQKPLEVAAETFLLRALTPSIGGTWTNLNSMVIRGTEPIAVDTGMGIKRDEWFEDVFSLVEPEDLRWIFLTHNDSDHAGNLAEALERCPNATVINSPGESFRTENALGVPHDRMRIVANGEDFEVGDRTLRAIRPPVYDSPYTHGVFDPTTRVYYSSDAFCAPMPELPVDYVGEMDADYWSDGFTRFHFGSLCPWIELADDDTFRREVGKLAALEIDVILGSHTPAIGKPSVTLALELMANLPSAVRCIT